MEETGSMGHKSAEGSERFSALDGATILEAYCQAQIAALPPGGRGLRAAGDLLTAIPAACRLGWADLTVSAPQLFRLLEEAGLLTGCPAEATPRRPSGWSRRSVGW